ncbi:hypothetical protein BDY24DRAFT_339134 [Mrakia frigida]|uniref:Mgp12p n=1 Tax=Mrakia frigida TaxID=29902 RepID=UPI003FCC269C
MPKPSSSLLPRLILYTGGPECSLCTVAKEQLALVRKNVPFELELFNIRKIEGEESVAAKERKKWRRLYMYHIPVLHLEGRGQIMKHRIDPDQLETLLKAWRPDEGGTGSN